MVYAVTLHSVGDDDDDDDNDNTSTSNVMIRDSIDDCTNGFGILDGIMYWMDMLLPVDLFVKVCRTCSVYCKTIGLLFVLGSGTNDLRSMSTVYLGCQARCFFCRDAICFGAYFHRMFFGR